MKKLTVSNMEKILKVAILNGFDMCKFEIENDEKNGLTLHADIKIEKLATKALQVASLFAKK